MTPHGRPCRLRRAGPPGASKRCGAQTSVLLEQTGPTVDAGLVQFSTVGHYPGRMTCSNAFSRRKERMGKQPGLVLHRKHLIALDLAPTLGPVCSESKEVCAPSCLFSTQLAASDIPRCKDFDTRRGRTTLLLYARR